MKKTIITLLAVTICSLVEAGQVSFSVQKIWSNGLHCAFTSIEKFNDAYYITFREAQRHVFDDDGQARGRIRIIKSTDGENWESVAVLSKEGYDLRDPKLSVTPDSRLMVIMGGSVYVDKKLEACRPQVSFSTDGTSFDEPQAVVFDESAVPDFSWLWRATWHEGKCYGVNYSKGDTYGLTLMSSSDGVHFSGVESFEISDFPNESTVRFLPDGRMAIMVRREKGNRHAYWGVSNIGFTEWEWKEMEFHVGGPDFIVLNDGTIIAGGRSHLIPSSPRTTLYVGDSTGSFREAVVLPSAGDNSYPGFLLVGNELWVSYYSTHETEKASIYLAKFPVEIFSQLTAH